MWVCLVSPHTALHLHLLRLMRTSLSNKSLTDTEDQKNVTPQVDRPQGWKHKASSSLFTISLFRCNSSPLCCCPIDGGKQLYITSNVQSPAVQVTLNGFFMFHGYTLTAVCCFWSDEVLCYFLPSNTELFWWKHPRKYSIPTKFVSACKADGECNGDESTLPSLQAQTFAWTS